MYRNITFFLVMIFIACTSAQAASQVYQISEGAANNSSPMFASVFAANYAINTKGIIYLNSNKILQETSVSKYGFDTTEIINLFKKPFAEGLISISSFSYQDEGFLGFNIEHTSKKQLCRYLSSYKFSCVDVTNDILDYRSYDYNRTGWITKQNDGLYFSFTFQSPFVGGNTTKINSSLTGSLKIIGAGLGIGGNRQLLIAYIEPTGKLSENRLQKIYSIDSYQFDAPAKVIAEIDVKGIVNPTTFASNEYLNVVAIETTPNLAKADERELYVCDSSVTGKCEFKKVARYESKLKGSVKASQNKVAYLTNAGVTIIDTNGKVLSTIKMPIDSFDYVEGEIVFQSKGHIYYQDMDYSKSRQLGIRVAEIEKRLQSVK